MTNIHELLDDLDAGVFLSKLEKALRETAIAVVSHGRKGKVTVQFDLDQIGESSQVTMAHKLTYAHPTPKGKISEENTTATPLHVGRGGDLSLFPEDQQDWVGRNKEGA